MNVSSTLPTERDTVATTAGRSVVGPWIRALRPTHWAKSFFVLAPFLIGRQFGFNEYLFRALGGAILFGLVSSAVYLFNDLIDAPSDRRHPTKRLRPIASGQISMMSAAVVSLGLFLSSLALGWLLDVRLFLILLAYAANNLLYSLYIKEKTVLDVMSISAGFVMRVYAGGFLIGIQVTDWLIACVFALSLLMGFGKRRADFETPSGEAPQRRRGPVSYTTDKLNVLLGISASITLVTYMLYSLAPETKALHGTDNLIMTTPFVVYCVYRFLLKVQEEGREPTDLIFADRGFLLAGSLWLISILYLTHKFQ